MPETSISMGSKRAWSQDSVQVKSESSEGQRDQQESLNRITSRKRQRREKGHLKYSTTAEGSSSKDGSSHSHSLLPGFEAIQSNFWNAPGLPNLKSLAATTRRRHSESSDASSNSRESNGLRKKKHREDDDDDDDDDEAYMDIGSPEEDFEIEAEFDREHAKPETGVRNVALELTQEKSRRMAQAMRIQEKARMGEGEKNLYLELALRGCKPVMYHHWKTDFSTLPESLFSSVDMSPDDTDSGEIIFKTKTRSEFHAIRAMKELLDLGGQVRDCSILSVYPPDVIQKAISKYVRWAIDDAGLEITHDTFSCHVMCIQKQRETTLDTVTKLVKRLTKLAMKFRIAYGYDHGDVFWPTLVGYVICGPIATILSLDSNPASPAWSGPVDSRVKYMGQFDLTEPDQDVWNSLALAISVIHVRETLLKLANTMSGHGAPLFRSQVEEYADSDE